MKDRLYPYTNGCFHKEAHQRERYATSIYTLTYMSRLETQGQILISFCFSRIDRYSNNKVSSQQVEYIASPWGWRRGSTIAPLAGHGSNCRWAVTSGEGRKRLWVRKDGVEGGGGGWVVRRLPAELEAPGAGKKDRRPHEPLWAYRCSYLSSLVRGRASKFVARH